MNVKESIIDALKNHFSTACNINDLVSYLNSININVTKRTVLIHIRRTLHIHKPNRKKDTIIYIKCPELPENFDDILVLDTPPENAEEVLFSFVKRFNYLPTERQFKLYLSTNYPSMHIAHYAELKKKMKRIINETHCFKLEV